MPYILSQSIEDVISIWHFFLTRNHYALLCFFVSVITSLAIVITSGCIFFHADYIPSGSNSPNYQSQRNTLAKPQLNEVSFSDGLRHSKPESSPTDKKMRLSELFKESLQEERVTSDDQTAGKICQKSSEKSPCVSQLNSICSSERTPNIDPKEEKEETLKATQCCLPSFVHSFSFRERKTPQRASHKENNTI